MGALSSTALRPPVKTKSVISFKGSLGAAFRSTSSAGTIVRKMPMNRAATSLMGPSSNWLSS